MSCKIHDTAVVDKKAVLGEDVVIGPYVVIGPDVRIGDTTEIGPHVVIHPYTSMGSGCKIHAGAIIGDTPQDLAFAGARSYVRIGSGCIIREGVTIHRGTKEETATLVGDHCYLMAFSHLGHNVELEQDVIIVNAALLAGYVKVGRGAFLSGNCVVHQFVRIGRLAMLGGLSGIGKDVPPFCLTTSAVRNEIRGLNVVGMRRAGINDNDRRAIKRAFQLLYKSGLNINQAVEAIRAEFTQGPALEFCDFIEHSERGLCGVRVRDEGEG